MTNLTNMLEYSLEFCRADGRPIENGVSYSNSFAYVAGTWRWGDSGEVLKLDSLAVFANVLVMNLPADVKVVAPVRNKSVINWQAEPRALVGEIDAMKAVEAIIEHRGGTTGFIVGDPAAGGIMIKEVLEPAEALIKEYESGTKFCERAESGVKA